MKRFLWTLLFLTVPLPTMAQAVYPFLQPGTYAVRSLCPKAGTMGLTAYDSAWAVLGTNLDDYCVNGRLGFTFTVTTPQTVPIVLSIDRQFGDPKMHIDPDCAEGPSTSCVVTALPDGTAVASGIFTYPGDVDWFYLPETTLRVNTFWTAPAKQGCFVSGQVVRTYPPEGIPQQYLAVMGGPSGCRYTIKGANRPTVE